MAEIWVNRTCSVCGLPVQPGEDAVLTATVKTTDKKQWEVRELQVRVNFFSGSARSLQHVVCPGEST